MPLARIRHIATFYKAFSMVPKGRHELLLVPLKVQLVPAGRVLEAARQLREDLDLDPCVVGRGQHQKDQVDGLIIEEHGS